MKRAFLFAIPLSVCNLRCKYCYLSSRDQCFEGVVPEMKYTPEQIAFAMRKERTGGTSYFNLCADGETLILPDLDRYVKSLVEQGHYCEIVSNMTLSKQLDRILSLGYDCLSHIAFKCSFHFLELERLGLLEQFAKNVNSASEAGASISVEVTPSDDLIPRIDEVKEFSLEHFGALPHLSIARNDSRKDIPRLTDLELDRYNEIWSSFESSFWDFKTEIFGQKRHERCYAGSLVYYTNMANGVATQCYCGKPLGDIFAKPLEPLPSMPIKNCPLAHCYNGHMLLTQGAIPHFTNVGYGDIRDRVREDGTHWLDASLKDFFNQEFCETKADLNCAAKKTPGIIASIKNRIVSLS